MNRFNGKIVVISGAARGMGAAHAAGFHREGASVLLADILPEGRQVADALGERALFAPLDVKDEAAWQAAIAAAEQAFGPVSILVNNAAVIEPRSILIEDFDVAYWRNVIDINLVGQMLGIKTVVPSMRKAGGGSIINLSSTAGFTAGIGHSAYVASKFGVRGLTKTAAVELGRYNIRVNCVHPGATDTPMHALTANPAGKVKPNSTGELKPDSMKKFAIGRLAAPEEISKMVMYLASDDASFSTGGEFIVDGGYLLGPALR